MGYEVIYVKEQCEHDPLFGATISPNPEDPRAYILPLEYAKRENADITSASSDFSNKLTINDVRNILNKACEGFQNVIPINAKDFVPQYNECFYEDNIHYSDLGNILFGNELIKEIKKYYGGSKNV